MLVDTHAHLDDPRLRGDLDAVLRRSREAEVAHVVTVGAGLDSSATAVEIARQHDMVRAAVGVHPHDADTVDDAVMARLADLARDDRVVAIGETGLDFHRNFSSRERQFRAFERHLDLALERNLPVVVHCRDAWDECLATLERRCGSGLRGVAHCFSGDAGHAERLRRMGFFMSFAGNVTYPDAGRLRETVARVSAEAVLVETDCPYLAPQPVRGRANEPAYVRHTAAALAAVFALTEDDVARVTSHNAYRLFGVGLTPEAGRVVYEIRGALYVNLTNRCSNACRFCPREADFTVKGHNLRLERDPSAEEVIAAIGDPRGYTEIVFCGFGEPTLRLDALKKVAAWVKQTAPRQRVRLNTNGHGSMVNGRPICGELRGLVDCVSVSMNTPNREEYVTLCRPGRGAEAFDAMLAFIEEARDALPETVVTTLDIPGGDLAGCRRIADRLGVPLRIRKYDDVGTLR